MASRLAELTERFERQARREQELGELETGRSAESWGEGLRRRWQAWRVRRHVLQDELLADCERLRESQVDLLRFRLQSTLRVRLLDFVQRNRGNLNRLSRAPFARTT